ncbi:MAG: AmmeMemoRadiSam system protein B [Desulfobacteraceae bacterium]|jgi:AmmeMemoRadiSam system protein B
MTMNTRKAVFAGSWYPDSPGSCELEIKEFLAQGPAPDSGDGSWLGGIVPHAGWYYSGQIACNVIHRLKEAAAPDLVVLFGMHLHPGSSNHMMTTGAWETPFGRLAVADDLVRHLKQRFAFQEETPQRFVQDNTIEVQLPFVKYLLDPKQILAIGVPPKRESLEIGRSVAAWCHANARRLKVIGSTDLTHYGSNYGYTPKGRGDQALEWVRKDNDRRVIDAMVSMEPEKVIDEGLAHQNACCAGAAATALAAVKQMGAQRSKEVAYATSYDKSPGDSFVGYVGVLFG